MSGVTIAGFTISNGWSGISVVDSSAIFRDNIISYNSYAGIYIEGVSLLIIENEIKNNGYGIKSYGSALTIQRNNISGNGTGIDATYHASAYISDNSIIGQSGYGIRVAANSTANIFRNTITGNGLGGSGIQIAGDNGMNISFNVVDDNISAYWVGAYNVKSNGVPW